MLHHNLLETHLIVPCSSCSLGIVKSHFFFCYSPPPPPPAKSSIFLTLFFMTLFFLVGDIALLLFLTIHSLIFPTCFLFKLWAQKSSLSNHIDFFSFSFIFDWFLLYSQNFLFYSFWTFLHPSKTFWPWDQKYIFFELLKFTLPQFGMHVRCWLTFLSFVHLNSKKLSFSPKVLCTPLL